MSKSKKIRLLTTRTEADHSCVPLLQTVTLLHVTFCVIRNAVTPTYLPHRPTHTTHLRSISFVLIFCSLFLLLVLFFIPYERNHFSSYVVLVREILIIFFRLQSFRKRSVLFHSSHKTLENSHYILICKYAQKEKIRRACFTF